MRETVDLEGLSSKVMDKYLKYLKQRMQAKIDEEM